MTPLDTGATIDETADAVLQPDPIAIRSHLNRLFRRIPTEYPGGLIEIAWSDARGQVTSGSSFPVTPEGIEAAVEKAVNENRKWSNIYVGVNPRRPGSRPFGRANGGDIEIAFFHFADCDGPPSVDRLRTALLPYTFAVTTGRTPAPRVHAYWELGEPTRNIIAWSAQQGAIRDHLGSDAVVDPPRIMRLGGTISYPPPRKAERGYVTEKVTIRTLYPNGGGVAAEREPVSSGQVVLAYPIVSPKHHPDGDDVHEGEGPPRPSDFGTGRIEALLAEINASPQWHNNTLRLVAHLVGRGFPDAAILALAAEIAQPGYTVDQTRGDLEKMIASARRKGWNGPKSDDSGWPDPDLSLLATEALPAPPFPEVLPAGWGKWARDGAESAGCAVDYVALPLIASAGNLIGNSRWAQPWLGWQEPPALYTGQIGRPSSGKSPGQKVVTDLLAQLEKSLNDDWGERRRAHKRDCAAAKERRTRWEGEVKDAVKAGGPPPDMSADAEDPEPPQFRRLFSTEPTVQKAALLVHGNPRGLLQIRDELAGWIGGMDLYSRGDGNDRAFWLQAYNGGHWAPDRVKDGEDAKIIPHLLWGISGGIQPDRVASKLLAGDDDGLAARFIYGWPVPMPPRRPRVVPDHTAALVALRRLIELPWQAPEPVILPFTADAADALQAFREEVADLEQGAAGLFLSWLGKLPGFCVRLALIREHLEWCWDGRAAVPAQIDLIAVSAAADFLENYAIPMARRVFGEATLPQAERDARGIARWLVNQKPVPKVVNERELRRTAHGPGIGSAERIGAALRELEEAGWVRRVPGRTAGHGRQRHDWAVNPLVLGLSQ